MRLKDFALNLNRLKVQTPHSFEALNVVAITPLLRRSVSN